MSNTVSLIELANEGEDTVWAKCSYELAPNIERLIGTNILPSQVLIGNELNNQIYAFAGQSTLNGKLGNDILYGSAGGADTFVFDTALDALQNVDQIVSFTVGKDVIQLNNDVFGAFVNTGILSDSQYDSGAGLTSAVTASACIIHNTSNGSLYYDADGFGGAAAVLFAQLSGNVALNASSFVVI